MSHHINCNCNVCRAVRKLTEQFVPTGTGMLLQDTESRTAIIEEKLEDLDRRLIALRNRITDNHVQMADKIHTIEVFACTTQESNAKMDRKIESVRENFKLSCIEMEDRLNRIFLSCIESNLEVQNALRLITTRMDTLEYKNN